MEQTGLTADELALRRTRSTGDIQSIDGPSRHLTRMSAPHRRSSHQYPMSASAAFFRDYNVNLPLPPPRLPEPAELRGTSPHSWHIPSLGLPPPEPQVRRSAPDDARPTPVPRGFMGKVMTFFGYAGPDAKARREYISVIWNVSFGIAQFIVIIVFLTIAAHRKSPTAPTMTEWEACDKLLGVWNTIWVVRVVIGVWLSYWGWRREVTIRALQNQRGSPQEVEAGRANGVRHTPNARSMHTHGRGASVREVRPPSNTPPTREEIAAGLPGTHIFTRLSLLTSIVSLGWFLAAHILEYTSVNTCRHAGPHLWWLTFGILCILYFMILEIFLLGLLVFILGPVLYLLWNIVLLCMGRHPLQNPQFIKPEIGKLPKAIVDQIPLVLYIPTPPEDHHESGGKPIAMPSPVYNYPPKRPAPSTGHRRRFAFFRKSKKKGANGKANGTASSGKGKDGGSPRDGLAWEENWEPGDYPFVRLEGNRAACAICLMDFEEPKRVDAVGGAAKEGGAGGDGDKNASSPVAEGEAQEVQVGEVTEEDRERLVLEDAGDGAQPLRLLACGHVFHKTCIDPWLIDVSGRCPVCQRPVELASNGKKDKRSR